MGVSMSGRELREEIAFVNRCILGQQPEAAPVVEKEDEMRPFLEKAKELLVQATIEIRKSMKAGTDSTVSPGEIKLMHQVEAQIEALAKLVKDGLGNE